MKETKLPRAWWFLAHGQFEELNELKVNLERWGNDQDTGVHFTLFGKQRKAIIQIYKINVYWVTCYVSKLL